LQNTYVAVRISEQRFIPKTEVAFFSQEKSHEIRVRDFGVAGCARRQPRRSRWMRIDFLVAADG
jgi:hypothetical protein